MSCRGYETAPDWGAVRAVQVLRTNGLSGLELPSRKLVGLHTRTLDPRAFARLMTRTTWIPADAPVLWKGGPLLLVELNSGRTLRFAASQCGTYVLQRRRQGWYEFADEDVAAWESLVGLR